MGQRLCVLVALAELLLASGFESTDSAFSVFLNTHPHHHPVKGTKQVSLCAKVGPQSVPCRHHGSFPMLHSPLPGWDTDQAGLGHQDWLPQTLIDSTFRGCWPPLALSRWPLGNRTGSGRVSDPAGNTEPKQESLTCAPRGLEGQVSVLAWSRQLCYFKTLARGWSEGTGPGQRSSTLQALRNVYTSQVWVLMCWETARREKEQGHQWAVCKGHQWAVCKGTQQAVCKRHYGLYVKERGRLGI